MCFFAAVTKVGWSQNPPLWQVRCDSKTKLCKTVWIWARRGQARMFGYWNQSTHPFRYLLVLYCWVQRCPINGAVSSLETTVSSVFWYQRMFLYIWLSLIALCHPQARSCGGPGARESESERERVDSSQETQAAFDKALKARESQEVVFAAIGGPRLKDMLWHASLFVLPFCSHTSRQAVSYW